MKATDLDVTVSCPVCDGTGDEPGKSQAYGGVCPRCDGEGTINRYRDGPDGKLVLREQYHDLGTHAVLLVETTPERDEETGGFEGRYGNWTPSDMTTGPLANYQQDTKDMLSNKPLGAGVNSNGEYQMPNEEPYNGAVFSAADMPGGVWPGDADLTMSQAIGWLKARGDTHTASVFEQIQTELSL